MQQAVTSFFSTAVAYPGDDDLTEHARNAVPAETGEVIAQVDSGSRSRRSRFRPSSQSR